MKYIPRILEKRIKERLFKGKVIIVYGARQVGKSTLVKHILAEYGDEGRYLNCELMSVVNGLSELEADKIKAYLGNYKLIVLDEAQNIPDIGKVLKIMVDTYPETQIIATGSSSFDLAQNISEPLTGRCFRFILYPLSLQELKQEGGLVEVEGRLENLMRFGSYPEIVTLGENAARERLQEIASDYLYKDVLKFEGIRKATLIKTLLQSLALQLGQEVSYNELANKLGVSRHTVEKYLDILEQSFVIFRLNSFSRNMRKEISKAVKIYFYDLGIRNSLIENFNRLEIRNDTGELWENFCILERRKYFENNLKSVSSYFWRTYDQKELDYVEEADGKIIGFEFKWNAGKVKYPKEFMEKYQAKVEVINNKNYWKFFGLG